jgi:hypothetical protein
MMGHFTYTLTLASAISAGLALYDRKTPRERIYRGIYLFGGFLFAIGGIGWIMYFINP